MFHAGAFLQLFAPARSRGMAAESVACLSNSSRARFCLVFENNLSQRLFLRMRNGNRDVVYSHALRNLFCCSGQPQHQRPPRPPPVPSPFIAASFTPNLPAYL